MSRLDDLLETCCPEGVEYKELQSLAEIGTGSSDRKDSSEDGEYPFYVRSKDVLRINKYEYDEEAIVIPGEGGIGEIFHFVQGKYALHQRAYRIHIVKPELTTKFLYYYMASHFKKFIMQKAVSATVTSIRKPMIEQFPVPVPPIEVQREIVRILDNFTELTAELIAELTARKKQYEYYRDSLLSFDTEVEWLTIDACTLKTQNIKWKDTVGDYEYIDLSSVDRDMSAIGETTTINADSAPSRAQQIVHTDDILFGTTRPLLKRYCMVPPQYDGQIASTGFCILRAKRGKVLPKYLYYVISTDAFYKHLEPLQIEGSYPSVTNTNVKSYCMPVPSVAVQARIVRVLDNFEAICNDLKIGLPAEISARQKQYEYYRDILLSFDSSQIVNVERERERERERAGARRADEIKLLQYVFGYANVRLEELFDTRNGYTPSKSNAAYWEGNTCVPWFRMEDIRENGRILTDATQHVTPEAVKGNPFPANSVIVATSATIGEHALITVPSLANQRFTYLLCKPEFSALIDMKYVFYYCFKLDVYCKEHLNQGNFASVDMSKFGAFMFSLPTVDRQKEIAKVLDRFDVLCNDISSGIPAEIEARRQQYEYYRDKLLTFKAKT